jgi:hypothetical protein
MIPLLLARKLLVRSGPSKETIIQNGMQPRSPLIDRWLLRWSRVDFLPQRFAGTSILVVARLK